MDIVDALDRSYEHAGRIVEGVRPEQWADETPCPLYDVRALLNHLVAVVRMFGAGLGGQSLSMADLAGDELGDDPAAAFRQATADNLAAWRRPGAMEATLELPFGPTPAAVAANLNLTDSLVHAWDLATATGQDGTIPDDLAETSLGFVSQMLKPEMRTTTPDAVFGPEVPVPTDAPASDRLVGFLGRQP